MKKISAYSPTYISEIEKFKFKLIDKETGERFLILND
jgi:hypothetical protein